MGRLQFHRTRPNALIRGHSSLRDLLALRSNPTQLCHSATAGRHPVNVRIIRPKNADPRINQRVTISCRRRASHAPCTSRSARTDCARATPWSLLHRPEWLGAWTQTKLPNEFMEGLSNKGLSDAQGGSIGGYPNRSMHD
jgi:hypothetical protein